MKCKFQMPKSIAHPFLVAAVFISFLIVGAGGNELAHYYQERNDGNISNEIHQSGFKYISPLLECTNFHNADKSAIEISINKIVAKKIEEKKISYASVYFRDLNNGAWVGINEKEEFTPASLLKVPLMISILKAAETDSNVLSAKIIVNAGDENLPQNIIPLHKVETGKTYTVEDLIKYMIIYSDNQAAGALLEHTTPEQLDQVFSNLGLKVPDNNDSENFMSVSEYTTFFRVLYNSSYLNREMSEKALEILSQSQFVDGLRAGVPASTIISHKFGERVLISGKQLHDCGIVYKTNRPYLLCVMTRGTDFNLMSQAISELSAATYNEFK